MTDHLRVSTENHVATVTLTSRTMPPAFFTELGETFRELALAPDLRCVVLRSDHKAFSYGLDLAKAFQEHGPLLTGANLAGLRTELLGLVRRWQADITAIADCPVPVICAINGWCIGGGLDVAAAADIRLASADAQLSLREVKLAIVADLGSLQRLPHIVGEARTRELAYTGRDVAANEALAMGLVTSIHANKEALDAAAQALATQIALGPPLTVRGIKQVMDYGRGKSVADGLEYVAAWNSAFMASEDLGEAVAAFLQKRAPVFKGK